MANKAMNKPAISNNQTKSRNWSRKKKHIVLKKRDENKIIAEQRISELFRQAIDMYNQDSKLSDRYVYLARKMAMKYKVKLTSLQKRKFCKHCYSFLMPGKNCIIRITGKTITYSCKICKKFTRLGYKKKSLKGSKDYFQTFIDR
ncbi:MAG: hypothetical protein ABIG89_05105 [Candidatus Woesearchaeota archaeon]